MILNESGLQNEPITITQSKSCLQTFESINKLDFSKNQPVSFFSNKRTAVKWKEDVEVKNKTLQKMTSFQKLSKIKLEIV